MLLWYEDTRIVNVMNAYIEMNNLQLELLQLLFTFTFAKRRIQCNVAH